MIELTFWRKVFIVVIVALAFAGGVSLGWIGRGLNEPVGGIPTTAAMQMVVEIEADPSATPVPTVGVPTSTAAPTVAQPTQTATASPTPEREEWEIDYCPPTAEGGGVTCWDIVVGDNGAVARLYWIGSCLDPYSLRLAKKAHGQVFRDLLSGEWTYKFQPNTCDRPDDEPSQNHLEVRTFAGPGEYSLVFSPIGGIETYVEFFDWSDAPPVSTPRATTEMTATPSGATVEETPVATFTMEPRVQSTTPLRGFAGSPTETLYDTPGDGAEWVGTIWYASPVFIWECGSPLGYPEGTYLSLVTHEGGGEVQVGWIATFAYTDRHPCSFYSAPGVGALVNYLVAAGYGDEATIRDLPGLQYDPYQGVETDLD